ncbi:MAG: flavodoxin [Lachnospiraceae bacterium]|nr:flavodoxin [Lachnospiraceae bacterium]
MNCAVVYFSRSGNTKKLADGVAEVLGVTASDITTSLTEKTDLVFLGSSLYAGGFDPAVGEFIRKNADKIGKLVCFGSSASGTSTAKKVKALASELGIAVYDDIFNCPGHFLFMHKDRPNDKDVEAVKDFTKSVLKKLS